MDELRFRTQHSPRNEATMPMGSLVSPPRNGNRLQQQTVPSHDSRSTLPRRFTTDSGRVPTLSSTTTQRAPEPQDFNSTQALHKVQLLEKKRIEYEKIREKKRRFEVEMQRLDQAQRREELELAQMQEDIGRMSGHQSEPTTPPEYRETTGLSNIWSRPNRYSLSSLTSPPGLYNRATRSGSVLTSPQSGIIPNRFAWDDQLPSRSVPGSRRNSDEDEKEEAVRQDPTSHRSSNAVNRYSMPVTKSRTGFYDIGLDQANTTGFLFGDDDSAPESKLYAETNPEDNFPTLVRRQEYPNILSASSAALDLARSTTSPDQDGPASSSSSVWFPRHRSQNSLSTVGSSQINRSASLTTSQQSSATDVSSLAGRSSVRHSLDMKYYEAAPEAPAANNSNNHVLASPPKLQTSFSANDVPTVKAVSGPSGVPTANTNQAAQQHLQNHNASLGRIPAGAMPNRHSRELSSDANAARDNAANYQSIGSTLQANAVPFGPALTQAPPANAIPSIASPQTMTPYNGGYYAGPTYTTASPANGANYSIPLLAMSMQGMSLNGSANMYSPQNYTGYAPVYAAPAQPRDSQARVIQSRRQLDNEAMSRYNNLPLESVGGTIYDLCKDQHGCRYLQKQLENRNPEQVHMIWVETNTHVVELMTDPFGNYLCQKLLEYCNDEERTVLIQNASQDMVRVALNQHGTRALQKMIEFVSTQDQVNLIIEALRGRVVDLIQDLNGNHVIQKCLNKLSARDAQFIFDAVGQNCVEVGTHRHGCCVLQRCIDHATGDQKRALIEHITKDAVPLVQDPFGNYVVQYIIDLNEPIFTEPVVQQFRTRISALSRHKFSSNVIEKCLRCASDPSKDMIVEELLAPGEMDRLLRDAFANYVIQTALEHATFYMKQRLVDTIRPILPNIRSTPYGRRIQAKIQAFDSNSGRSSGQITPADPTGGQIPLRPAHNRAMSNNTSILAPGGYANGVNGAGNRVQGNYPSSSILTVPPPQPARSQQYPPPPQYQNRGPTGINGANAPAGPGVPADSEQTWL